MPVDLNAHRDPQLEHTLTEYGITPPCPVLVDPDEVDWPASYAQQIRDHTAKPAVVERYTEAARDGAVFPATLVRKLPDGREVILAGIHRFIAHRAADRPVAAYVIECGDDVARTLAIVDNSTHGEPLTNAERVRHGLALLDDGYKVQTAARLVGLSRNMLDRARTVRAGETRARRLGVKPMYDRQPVTAQWRLTNIQDDDLFRDAVTVVAEDGLNVDQVFDMVTSVNKAPDAHAAGVVIRDAAMAQRARNKRAGNPGQGNQIGRVTDGVFRILDADHRLAVEQCSPGERAHIARHIRRCIERLNGIAADLEAG